MFQSPSFIFLSLTISLSSAQTCYWPDGSVAPNYAPCSTTSSVSMCSYTPHADKCEPNGLILGTNGEYFRNACSDPSWPSPGCVALCPWNSTTYAGLTHCTDGSFCCGASNTTCCSSNQGVFLADNVASIILPTTSIPLPTQTATSQMAQTSTTEPPQSSSTESPHPSTEPPQSSSTESPHPFIVPATQKSTPSPTSSILTLSSTTRSTSPTGTGPSFANSANTTNSPSQSSKSNNLEIGLGAGLGVALLLGLGVALGCGAHYWLKKKRNDAGELPGPSDNHYTGFNNAANREKLNFQVATQGTERTYGSSNGTEGMSSVYELHARQSVVD